MKSHRIVQVLAIGLAIYSPTIFGASAAESTGPKNRPSQKMEKARAGGGGDRVFGIRVSGETPKQRNAAKLMPVAKTARRALL